MTGDGFQHSSLKFHGDDLGIIGFISGFIIGFIIEIYHEI